MNRIVLKGGQCYDGSGAAATTSDVLIEGDAVARVAPSIDIATLPPGAETIDCSGCAVAPGFIDIHGHSDNALLCYPLAESRVLSGVTTEVCGNCGGSAFPLNKELQQRSERVIFDQAFAVDWVDAQGYFRRSEEIGSSINRAFLVGHGNLRAMTVGFASGEATAEQLKEMARLLQQGLEAGAYGLSSGLIYPPGCYSPISELIHLSKVVGRLGGLYASHIRSESRALLEAVGEFITIIEEGGCRGVISHVKTMNPANWHKINNLVALLEAARGRGLRLYCDRYPYLASWTGLDSTLFPDWLFDGGLEAEMDRLRDPALRDRLDAGRRQAHPEADWAERILVISCHTAANQALAGLTLAELGRHWKLDPLDAAIRLLLEEETRVSSAFFGMSEENLRRLLALPYVCVASDASIRNPAHPEARMAHPRTFGTPARFLGEYVRDKGLMSWGEGIRRLTGLPAEIFGWKRRGRLGPGTVADVVVFRPDQIADRATYKDPAVTPAGIRHVLVAGQFVARDGRHTGAKPGRVLRRGAAE